MFGQTAESRTLNADRGSRCEHDSSRTTKESQPPVAHQRWTEREPSAVDIASAVRTPEFVGWIRKPSGFWHSGMQGNAGAEEQPAVDTVLPDGFGSRSAPCC